LSKATDRFPSELQWTLLLNIFDWLKTIKNEFKEFVLRPKVTYRSSDGQLTDTEYKVGSPMGIYTSWASFSLCHHLLVRIAGYYNAIKTNDRYLIIGDDIVISDNKLATAYKGLLTKLEISFKESDSFVSSQDKSIAEFAKRLFINGRELSPLPLRLLEDNLASEAAFLVRCNEIGHQLSFNPFLYPGNSNRVELLLLCSYTFRRIQKALPVQSAPLTRITDEYLANTIKDWLGTELGNARDIWSSRTDPSKLREKSISKFILNLYGKEIHIDYCFRNQNYGFTRLGYITSREDKT
jgi:hypothetical protein